MAFQDVAPQSSSLYELELRCFKASKLKALVFSRQCRQTNLSIRQFLPDLADLRPGICFQIFFRVEHRELLPAVVRASASHDTGIESGAPTPEQQARAADDEARLKQENAVLGLRGRYGTPYGPGPQFGEGGDQYGYGPAYSYARQAPSLPEETDEKH